jgi:hypothetical protein
MIKYDTWQVFWLSVHFTFPLINSGVREVTFLPLSAAAEKLGGAALQLRG